MGVMVMLLFVGALVGFVLVLRRWARCLGWVVGMVCLIGFLYLVGVLR